MQILAVNIEEQHRNLQYNVAIIGWLGNIISSMTLVCAAATLHFRNDIVDVLQTFLQRGDGDGENNVELRFCLSNLVVVGSTIGYVLSLVNVLVSSMLLIGVARRCCALIIPWLLYYGFLFGTAVHLALYLTICSLCLDVAMFCTSLMVFTMALLIFAKIYHEVFLLFKTMHAVQKARRLEIRNNVATVTSCSQASETMSCILRQLEAQEVDV